MGASYMRRIPILSANISSAGASNVTAGNDGYVCDVSAASVPPSECPVKEMCCTFGYRVNAPFSSSF